jgi:hypothetical protein
VSRTIIVGDVHGCARELDALLDKVAFANGDRLVFVGDVLSRGPDSLGVLDVVRRSGAVLVRGNHEQRLLDWLDRMDDPAISRMHRTLARMLRPIDWSLIATSKIWVDFPEHDLRVVHAGVDPTVRLEAQKPDTMMKIRTVGGALWGSRYHGPPHVVFGHNAAPGLQLHPWATGLDTGCVYGGRLTALVLGPGRKVPRTLPARRALLTSVPARRVWSIPGALR